MLNGLTKRSRIRSALALAAVYAFCVLAPGVALAITNGAAHCLTEDHAAAHVHKAKPEPVAHTHADGTKHHHGVASAAHDPQGSEDQRSDHAGKDHKGNCCGLFCVTALALDARVALPAPPELSAYLPGLEDALIGRGPGRLNRPPIG